MFALDARIASGRMTLSFSLAALTVRELAPPALIECRRGLGFRAGKADR